MSTDRTVILHLSDIHFKSGMTGTAQDLDDDVRNELEKDAGIMLRELGRIDAIVVTGDVAFAGKPGEYESAADWLKSIARRLGCSAARIWAVPGNHDVDWGEIDGNPMLRLMHEKLRTVELPRVNEGLVEFLRDPRLGEELLRPLKAYREFANDFSCGFTKEKPFWEKDLPLNDGSTLQVRGVTSTFVSRSNDEGNLVLGLAPATLKRLHGVVYMTLCHHPLEWFREREELDKLLTARARILLFGHKHQQRVRRLEDTVMLVAGAVHPYRREKPWQPRYNFLAISVACQDADRRLEIEVYPRLWSDESIRFEPALYQGRPSRRYGFEIEPWTPEWQVNGVSKTSEAYPVEVKSDAEIIMTMALEMATPQQSENAVMDAALALADRFWRLPYHIRVKILRQLGLTEENDKQLPEEQRVVLAFRRAREREMLGALREVVQRYTDLQSGGTNDASAA